MEKEHIHQSKQTAQSHVFSGHVYMFFAFDIGEDINFEAVKQLKKVEDEDIGLGGDGRNFSKLSENDRIVAELLRGLAVSKRGEGENSYSRHSFLSVGLAELLSDQMGKLDKAVIKPNIGKGRDEVCLKAEGLLNEIPAGIVKNQYKTAWDILKSEIY